MVALRERPSCECEHISHFNNEPDSVKKSERVHGYGQVPATRLVETDWGTFKMCEKCSQGHGMPSWYRNPRVI